MQYTVLVCDDDPVISEAIRIYLDAQGYRVLLAADGEEAIALAGSTEIHCMLLDVMMPHTDGMQALLRLRKDEHRFPIILLTAKSEEADVVAGLAGGADDYVTKPFKPMELMMRVKSQIRRYTTLGALEQNDHLLITGGLVLDREQKEVTVDGEPVHLTGMEYAILLYLMEHMGWVLSTGQIYEAIWHEPSYGVEKSVTVHIRNIRKKIEINPSDPKYLKVVWGLGYKIEKINP